MQSNTGTIKWFNTKKGFGFITRDEDQKEIFVHHSELQVTRGDSGLKEIAEGTKVAFVVESTEKGLIAKDVKPE